MFHTIEEALSWIHTRKGNGPKPGIKRMEWMMERLGQPHNKFPAIHIAGTNGKGSTVAYLTSLFLENGFTVGSFTSPHIMRFNERIAMNGEPISDHAIINLCNELYPVYQEISETELGALTEFELITCMMFVYFSKHVPDVVLVEVGLGGLFDSTNVLTPVVSVITTIGFDHIRILGNTMEDIAFQKGGIIKPNVPVVLGNIQSPSVEVLLKIANQQHSTVRQYGVDFSYENSVPQERGEKFTYVADGVRIEQLVISLLGTHQIENAVTAITAFRLFCSIQKRSIYEAHIREGLRKAFWPVRMEIMQEHPLVILDGAHNEPAMEVLTKALHVHYPNKPISILYASLTTKELEPIGQWLATIPNAEYHLSTFDFPNAATLEELQRGLGLPKTKSWEHWQDAIQNLLQQVPRDGILLITGSLYFLSEVRKFFVP